MYDAVAVTGNWLTGAVADSELQLDFPTTAGFAATETASAGACSGGSEVLFGTHAQNGLGNGL